MKYRERKKERELLLLEDFCVVDALLILVFALIFLIDILRNQWILWIILVLGIVLNLSIAVCGILHKKPVMTIAAFLLFLGFTSFLIYMAITLNS